MKFSRDKIRLLLCEDFSLSSVLSKALKGEDIKETALYKNLTDPFYNNDEYWLEGFFDEYKKTETVSEAEIIEARKKVVEAISKLVMSGKIVIDEK
jgi:hypothetical protein